MIYRIGELERLAYINGHTDIAKVMAELSDYAGSYEQLNVSFELLEEIKQPKEPQ